MTADDRAGSGRVIPVATRQEFYMQRDSSAQGWILFGMYLIIVLTPLGISLAVGYPPPQSGLDSALNVAPRAWYDHIGSGLALVAYPMLLLEFASTGRIQFITGWVSYNRTLSFHRMAAIGLGIMALAHPYFYYVPESLLPIYSQQDVPHLHLTASTATSGVAAWLLLVVLIVLALARNRIPYRYEIWRITHILLAVAIAGLVLHHALLAGRYTQTAELTSFWIATVVLCGLSLVYVLLILPLHQRRQPYRLTGKIRMNDKEWSLSFEADGFMPGTFYKGQVVWICFDSPFSLLEHPFSVAADSSGSPAISFSLTERGDWTGHIKDLQLGARAYLNGPYG